MKRLWNSFKIAFAMYSKIPMPRADWEKENMRYMMCFFPLIGMVIGACMVIWSYAADWLQAETILRTAVYVLIPVAITGGIHLDGLLDTADALNSYQTRERKLEILKDSHAGAFAVIIACCYFIASFGVWSELTPDQVRVLAGGYVLSRALSGLAVAIFPCAKSSGTVAMFADAAQKRCVEICMLLFIGFAAAYAILMRGKYGLAMLLGAGLTYLWYYRMSKREFGGITGDLAGCFLQVCELVMAAAVYLAGRW
jgi:adenosylcobinamide-GDP ribazoletransferase